MHHANFDALVEAEVKRRMRAFIDAMRIAPNEDYSDMTAEGIRARAVAAVKGPEAIDDRESDAIEAVFDHLVDQCTGDPVRRTLSARRLN
ncbi:hypothetical protein [Algiphilus sp.]|uniref:hypothetical protein n=1 Tax=Algiphilus sp. TaxID=1872431 RepID=UPI0032EBBA77